DDAGTQIGLALLEVRGEVLFRRPGAMAAAEGLFVARAGIGRMMEHDEHESCPGREVIEFMLKPPALRTAHFVKRAVQRQHHPARTLDRVEAVAPQTGEASEIVSERDGYIAVEIMVSERGIDRDAALAPDSRFLVVDFPVFGFVAVVGDVAAK